MSDEATVGTRYRHNDGRMCSWDPMHAVWRHWDHEQPEPKPGERRSYTCRRDHPDLDAHRPTDDKPPCSCEPRGLHRLPDPYCPQHYPVRVSESGDRGEFGHPGLGSRMMVIPNGMEVQFIDPNQEDKIERVQNIIYEAMNLYSRKAAGYKGVEGDLADHLGVKGQFVDINRKFWRIKAMLWDEVVPMYPDAGMGEDVEEVLMDFIGHAALTIDFLRQSQAQEPNGEGEA